MDAETFAPIGIGSDLTAMADYARMLMEVYRRKGNLGAGEHWDELVGTDSLNANHSRTAPTFRRCRHGAVDHLVTDTYPRILGCFKGTPNTSFNKRTG